MIFCAFLSSQSHEEIFRVPGYRIHTYLSTDVLWYLMDEASKIKATYQPFVSYVTYYDIWCLLRLPQSDCQPSSDIIFQEKCTCFSLAQEKRIRFLSNLCIGSSNKSDQTKREKLLDTNLFYRTFYDIWWMRSIQNKSYLLTYCIVRYILWLYPLTGTIWASKNNLSITNHDSRSHKIEYLPTYLRFMISRLEGKK